MLSLFFFIVNLLVQLFHSKKKVYYQKSPLEFIQQFGSYYELFDNYFSHENVSFPTVSINQSISNLYRVRKLANYYNWGYTSISNHTKWSKFDIYPQILRNPSDPNDIRILQIEYNNRFRFGKADYDRFLAIFTNHDPWDYPDSSFVHFVGLGSTLMQNKKQFHCRFYQPNDTIKAKPFNSNLILEYHSPNCVLKCLIPPLTITNFKPLSIFLDLYETTANQSIPVLESITIPRLHSMDRRHFNLSMYAMVSSINDTMIKEWLLHHIMLGVEHFYLFDNSKVYPYPPNLETSILRPFLEANIITLIHFPYTSPNKDHWAPIQRVTFSVILQQFGHYNYWLGLNDIDEFYLAAPKDWYKLSSATPQRSLLREILELSDQNRHHGAHHPNGGIMFHTLEVGCSDEQNYFMSLTLTKRQAVTMTCHNQHGLHSFGTSHTKVILKTPLHCCSLENSHWVPYGKPVEFLEAGRFHHFNKLRYTNAMQMKSTPGSLILRNFTLLLITKVLGLQINY